MKPIPPALLLMLCLASPALAGPADDFTDSYGVHGMLTLNIPLQPAGDEPAPVGLGFDFDIKREQNLFSRRDSFDLSTGAREPLFDATPMQTFRIQPYQGPAVSDSRGDAEEYYDDRRF